MASHTTKSIRDLLKHIESDELVLPEIQRDFVWTRRSVMKLFESLFRSMPIGHILVWKARQAVDVKAFSKKPNPQNPGQIESFYGYLLDGQQRLTAIGRVKDRDPDYPLRFDLRSIPADPKTTRFAWETARNKEDPWFVSVADVLNKSLTPVQMLDEIRAREKVPPEEVEAIHGDFMKLQCILDYLVGITEFESDDYREATELFIRFNGTGRRLSKSDLAMAELALSVPGLAGNEMMCVRRRWPQFPFTAPFLVQCLLAVHTDRLALKEVSTAWGQTNPKAVKVSWKKLEKAIEQVMAFLTGTVRWRRLSTLPSINALVPLIYTVAAAGKFEVADRERARRWLHLVTLHYHFSGSANTTVDRMIRKVAESPTMKALWNATTKASLKPMRSPDFETSRLNGPEMALFTAMLSAADAKDWIALDRRLDGSVQGKHAELQVHHFFPRALLRKHGIQDDRINTMGNYTVICAETNLDVSTEEPATYIERIKVPEEQLIAQYIPLDRGLWRVLNYEKFIAAREKLLAEGCNKYLGLT
jgi:hypothetical protein